METPAPAEVQSPVRQSIVTPRRSETIVKTRNEVYVTAMGKMFEEKMQPGDKVIFSDSLGCRVNLSQLNRVAKKMKKINCQHPNNHPDCHAVKPTTDYCDCHWCVFHSRFNKADEQHGHSEGDS